MKKLLFFMCALSALSLAEGTTGTDKNPAIIPVKSQVTILPEEVSFKITDNSEKDLTEVILNHGEIKNGSQVSELENKVVTSTIKVIQTTPGLFTEGNITARLDNMFPTNLPLVSEDGEKTVGLNVDLSSQVTQSKIGGEKGNKAEITLTSSLKNYRPNGIYEKANKVYTTEPINLIVTYNKVNGDY